jgi:hypothetical protein
MSLKMRLRTDWRELMGEGGEVLGMVLWRRGMRGGGGRRELLLLGGLGLVGWRGRLLGLRR